MKYDPARLHRRSIRLRGYDYSQPGAYFITIVARDRACLFGEVVDGKMWLNDAGRMIGQTWEEIPSSYPGVETYAFVIMPNHIHGVIILVGAGPRACPYTYTNPQTNSPTKPHTCPESPTKPQGIGQPQGTGQPQGVAPTMSLPDVVHRFKTLTTKRYIDGVKSRGWLPFPGRLWQRNYYEHVIRNDESLERIRQYITENPLQWVMDRENTNVVAACRVTLQRAPIMEDQPCRI